MSKVVSTFRYAGRSYSQKPGQAAVFKVRLKSDQGDCLVVVSESKDIYDAYVEGESYTVTIVKAQKTLAEFPEEEDE